MVGAIMIARKRVLLSDDERPMLETDVRVRPGTPLDDNPHSISVDGQPGPRNREREFAEL